MSDPAPATASPSPKKKGAKLCRVCGKDLRGHRRIRDGDTYICPVCDKMEREGQIPDGVPCAECGKQISPTLLRRYGDILICPKCFRDHEEDPKRKARRVSNTMFHLEDKRTVATLAAVAAVLLLLILLGLMT